MSQSQLALRKEVEPEKKAKHVGIVVL